MEYKVTKKADGWYVGGEHFSSQGAATKRLIALLSGGKSTTKPRPSRQAASSEMYPKGPGRVSGSVFKETATGTMWKLAEGFRGINIEARADGKGYVSVYGTSVAVTGVFEEPKASQKPRVKEAAASRFHLIESGVPGLVNGEHLEGYEAKVVGPVSYPPEGLNPDVSYVVLVSKIRSGKEVYDVVAFDDESLYDDKIYKNIPDLKTAEMLAEGAWRTMNHHAMRYTPEFFAAVDKYKA